MVRARGARWERRGGLLAGCLTLIGALVVLLIVAVVLLVIYGRGWLAAAGLLIAEQALEETELPELERQEILDHLDALAEDFKARRVSWTQLRSVAESIVRSPLLPAAAVYAARKEYFDPSGLSAEEKANAELQMQRLARGVFEGTITIDEMEDVVDAIAVRTDEHTWRFKDRKIVSDEDLRQMVSEVTTLVDQKGIPAEPFTIDVSDEIGRAIDRALGRVPADGRDGGSTGEGSGAGG